MFTLFYLGKQTMATPTHTWQFNAETKMYRLQTPTSPLFRPYHYDAIGWFLFYFINKKKNFS